MPFLDALMKRLESFDFKRDPNMKYRLGLVCELSNFKYLKNVFSSNRSSMNVCVTCKLYGNCSIFEEEGNGVLFFELSPIWGQNGSNLAQKLCSYPTFCS